MLRLKIGIQIKSPAYLAHASTHTSAAVQVQCAQPMQYVYAQPAHFQVTVQAEHIELAQEQVAQQQKYV